MQEKAVIMDEKAMARAIIRMSFEIIERNSGVENLCIIGILRRGTVIAQKIRDKISEVEGKEISIGSLDITPYRDDQQKGKAVSDDSCIPFDAVSYTHLDVYKRQVFIHCIGLCININGRALVLRY